MTDPIPPFWLVWRRANGRTPVREHASYREARIEAERLARANPGEAFYVLTPCARAATETAIIWSHFEPTGLEAVDDVGEHGPQEAGL